VTAIDLQRLNDALAGTRFQGKLHHFPLIDSTQSRALTDAQAGAEDGQVYLADEQTAGRGRAGHTWHSEPDRGLYLTVLVRPKLRSNDALQLSLATALAAQAAILEQTASLIDLRWPNDLVFASEAGIPSRKVGGILTETVLGPDGSLRHAAIGIGINLHQAEFPTALQSTATSLRLATGQMVARDSLAISLLQHLAHELQQLDSSPSKATNTLLERFAAASTWVQGRRVHVTEDESYTGMTDGLTPEGLLRVRTADGTIRIVRHGGVREATGESHHP